jgi:hypothetical protein
MSYTVRHRPRGAEHTPCAQGLPLYDMVGSSHGYRRRQSMQHLNRRRSENLRETKSPLCS